MTVPHIDNDTCMFMSFLLTLATDKECMDNLLDKRLEEFVTSCGDKNFALSTIDKIIDAANKLKDKIAASNN